MTRGPFTDDELSTQQFSALAMIERWRRDRGCMPRLKEISAECGYYADSSHGTARKAIKALVKRGFLSEGREGLRSVQLTDRGREALRHPQLARAWGGWGRR